MRMKRCNPWNAYEVPKKTCPIAERDKYRQEQKEVIYYGNYIYINQENENPKSPEDLKIKTLDIISNEFEQEHNNKICACYNKKEN